MTREEMIKLAKECGAMELGGAFIFDIPDIETHTRAIQKAERERCAKVCDSKIKEEYETGKVDHNEMAWTMCCAEAIRELED